MRLRLHIFNIFFPARFRFPDAPYCDGSRTWERTVRRRAAKST
jgi:hypothetical protein